MIDGFSKTTVRLSSGESAPIAELLGPLPEELKPLCRELKMRLKQLNQGTLDGYLEIGELIKKEYDIIEADSEKRKPTAYGSRFFERLGAELDINPQTLRDCVKVFEFFGGEKYRSLFVKHGVTWSHASLLAQVSVTTVGEDLLKRAIAKRLSCKELNDVINRTVAKTPRGQGRSPAKPRNLNAALGRLRSASKTYHSIMQQALFSEQFDVPTEIDHTPPDQLTPQTREVVSECIERLAEIGQTNRDAHDRLKACLNRIDSAIVAQELQPQAADEDEHDLVGSGGRRSRSC